MKRELLLLVGGLVFFLFSLDCYAQQTISKSSEAVILEATQRTVENYTRYLELLAEETDKDVVDIYKSELLKAVEKKDIYVYNDLIPEEDRPSQTEENIDILDTYLEDINSRYLNGVTIIYKNFKASKIYKDTVRQRLFVKITADREINGTYFYKNEKKDHQHEEQMDFYVGIELKENGVPEGRIYSVYKHYKNEEKFIPIEVVEKTEPIEFSRNIFAATFKRGKEMSLTWEGGEVFERLKIDLYKQRKGERKLVQVIDSSFVNDNKMTALLPGKMKPGKNNQYYFQITKLNSKEAPVKSEIFYVRRKTSLGVKTLITGVVVTGVLILKPWEGPIIIEQGEEQLNDNLPDPNKENHEEIF